MNMMLSAHKIEVIRWGESRDAGNSRNIRNRVYIDWVSSENSKRLHQTNASKRQEVWYIRKK